MRLHFCVHLAHESRHNIIAWADQKGHPAAFTRVLNGDTFPSLKDFDWLIVMGGFQSAWQDETYPWLPVEKKLIIAALKAGKTVLGICFGAQVLADVLGGKTFPNEHQEIGWHEISLTAEGRESFLFRNVPDKFLTFLWHGDHFSLPADCIRLAYSEYTPNQAFISRRYQAIGLQFHPEITRQAVRQAAEKFGSKWVKGPYVKGKEAILAQTDHIPETYCLMETLLNNMADEFGSEAAG